MPSKISFQSNHLFEAPSPNTFILPTVVVIYLPTVEGLLNDEVTLSHTLATLGIFSSEQLTAAHQRTDWKSGGLVKLRGSRLVTSACAFSSSLQ